MTEKDEKEFTFRHIDYKDRKKLKEQRPALYKELYFFWRVIESCPDISDNFPVFFYIVNQSDQIVSSLRAYPDTLLMDKRSYKWAWLGDLFTDENYRGKGLATLIIKGSRKVLHEKGIAWGGVSSNEIALHIYNKLGYYFPGYAKRHLLLKSIRPFLEVHCKWKIFVKVCDLIYMPIARLFYIFYYRIKKLDKLDKNIELKRIEQGYSGPPLRPLMYENEFHFNDNLQRLIWKTDCSNIKDENTCDMYLLRKVGSEVPLCYFVLRMKNQTEPLAEKYKNFKRMTLMDWGLLKKDQKIYYLLLRQIIRLFWENDAEVLDILSNSKELEKIIEEFRLFKIGKGMSFVYSIPGNWMLEKGHEELVNWQLTHFTGDSFTF